MRADLSSGDILLEVSLGSVGHNQAASLLLDSAGQRELDLGVVHLLDQGTTGLVSGNSLTPAQGTLF